MVQSTSENAGNVNSNIRSSDVGSLAEPPIASVQDVDWRRLKGYRAACNIKKNPSWIWKHGYRLWNEDELEYWLCTRCHHGSVKRPFPKGHIFQTTRATSTAAQHMTKHHSIDENGAVTPSRPVLKRKLEDCNFDANTVQQRTVSSFDRNRFRALLLEWIIADSIPFQKIESEHFRRVLTFAGYNLRLEDHLPSRTTLSRWVGRAYDQQFVAVKEVVRSAATRINLSFDLWTSHNQLALLGLVAHFLDHSGLPRTLLLSLPRQRGRHCGHGISGIIAEVVREFDIGNKLGYFITDNASNNATCLQFLGEEFNFSAPERHVRCTGHVLNLVAKAILFGSDVDAFESELQDVNVEEQELERWRKKGPTGRLHNIVKFITASPQRVEAFEEIQRKNLADEDNGNVLKLVKDNFTRWNSFDDCAERAIKLRVSIDEFIEEERDNWINYQRRPDQRRHERRYARGKEPSILQDQLSSDDWDVLVQYHEILRPFKSATLHLQGQIGGRTGAIWQVLPVFERLLTHLEDQRYTHRPLESQKDRSNGCNNQQEKESPKPEYLATEHHFSTNINLGWQKLDEYYARLDQSPIFCAAVVLHPRQKWRWFEKHWAGHKEWIDQAKLSVEQLWRSYKNDEPAVQRQRSPGRASVQVDEWSDDEEDVQLSIDQLVQYYAEPPHDRSLPVDMSPIPYWVAKKSVWPELAAMALDIYSVPAMSDEPERIFSQTGHILAPRRRSLTSKSMKQLMCMKSWLKQGVAHLDGSLFERTVMTIDPANTITELEDLSDVSDEEYDSM
jgi:hypothetical protein